MATDTATYRVVAIAAFIRMADGDTLYRQSGAIVPPTEELYEGEIDRLLGAKGIELVVVPAKASKSSASSAE